MIQTSNPVPAVIDRTFAYKVCDANNREIFRNEIGIEFSLACLFYQQKPTLRKLTDLTIELTADEIS